MCKTGKINTNLVSDDYKNTNFRIHLNVLNDPPLEIGMKEKISNHVFANFEWKWSLAWIYDGARRTGRWWAEVARTVHYSIAIIIKEYRSRISSTLDKRQD